MSFASIGPATPIKLQGSPESGHPLYTRFTFWYHKKSHSKEVERFWDIYSHVIRPDDSNGTIEYYVFREGVKPLWEDPINAKGGKWTFKLKKGLATYCWESLLLGLIGGAFEMGEELCGVAISVRTHEDHLAVWHKTTSDDAAKQHVKEVFEKLIVMPGHTCEYKRHDAHTHSSHKTHGHSSSKYVRREEEEEAPAPAPGPRPHRLHWSLDDGPVGRPYKPFGKPAHSGSRARGEEE